MRFPATITANEMRNINRTAVLEVIRRSGPVARSDIAHALNISLPTVMRVMEELVAEELVRETGESEWSGGRRRPLLALNATRHLTLGLDLGGSAFYGAVADLGGKVLYEQTLPLEGARGEAAYARAAALAVDLLAFARTTGRAVRGIGAGAPGVTLHEEGVVRWAPGLAWRDFPLRERLRADFDLPVIVENDVNLAALGEMWFGAGQDARNLVLISIGNGIGAGIVLDGVLFRGTNQTAGEIGYLLPGREFLKQDYTDFGALEHLAAGAGMTRRAQKEAKGALPKAARKALAAADVLEASRRGEAWAAGIVEETLDYLTLAVASVSAFFDPEVVVLGGELAPAFDRPVERILERVAGKVPAMPMLVASTLGRRAAVMGAVINLLHNTSDFYVVRKLS